MRIIELRAENVKRIHAVSIKPDGNVVQITGRNGAGKSSVLDSIAYALGGGSGICDKPIRRGEKRAEVTIDLGDLVVTRSFTEGGGSLTVANKEGARYQSPQGILDRLVGQLTLDPLAFSRMPVKAQVETLRGLAGLDFTELDKERATAYAERTTYNRSLASAQASLAQIPHHDDAPAVEVSINDLITERDRRVQHNANNALARRTAAMIEGEVAGLNQQIADAPQRQQEMGERLHQAISDADDNLKRQIDRLRKDHAEKIKQLNLQHDHDRGVLQASLQTLQSKLADAQARHAGVTITDDVDPNEVSQQISAAQITNRKVQENARRQIAVDQVNDLTAKSDGMTKRIERIDADKAEAIATARFPVDGLAFDDTGVTFGGVPFNQASSAEQLRASVAIGLALNPKLRVLLIRDGSLLDTAGMTLLAEIADQHDAQIWVERVEDGGNVGVVIEDGAVVTKS